MRSIMSNWVPPTVLTWNRLGFFGEGSNSPYFYDLWACVFFSCDVKGINSSARHAERSQKTRHTCLYLNVPLKLEYSTWYVFSHWKRFGAFGYIWVTSQAVWFSLPGRRGSYVFNVSYAFVIFPKDPKHSPRPAKQWSSKSHEEYLSTPSISSEESKEIPPEKMFLFGSPNKEDVPFNCSIMLHGLHVLFERWWTCRKFFEMLLANR